MTVSTSYTPLTYNGNGSQTAFTVTWQFFTGSLVVTAIAANGVETVKTLTTHYTVTGGTTSGLPATGTVTMLVAPASGTQLRIERSTPLTQASTWAESSNFPQKTIEAMADKLTLISQEVTWYAQNRAINLDSSGATDFWDAESKNIRNLADGTAATDAVNLQQLQAVEAGQPSSFEGAEEGSIIWYQDGAWVGLAPGEEGQVLRIEGGIPVYFTADGLGDMLGASNLSDVANVATARTNLGLGTGNSPAFAGLTVGGETPLLPSGFASNAEAQAASSTTKILVPANLAAATLMQGKHTVPLMAASMTPRDTNGASRNTVELTSNDIMLVSLDFDKDTEEGAGVWVPMPSSWNEGTVTFRARWTAASGSGGVAWGLAARAYGDDDAMDTAVSGQQIVTDTLITANDMHVTSESSAITIGGSPAAGDSVYFEITREVANGSDTLTVDAKLLGIDLFMTLNAATDA